MATTGGVLLTEMMSVVVEVCEVLSVTVSVTVYFVGTPGVAVKVCEGFAVVPFAVPSPQFQL